MRNKIIFVLLAWMLVASITVLGQTSTSSPYSKYGIGIIRPQSFGQNFGMGGTAIGLRSSRDIRMQNPASYSAITATTFDIGYTNNALWMDDGAQSRYQNDSYLDHLAFAFPMIKNVWGMSFGILPYSNVGYEYDKIETKDFAGDSLNSGEISVFSEGAGAINKVYFGNAVSINIDSTSLVSIGANGYFLFGSISYDQKMIFGDLPGAFNVWSSRDMVVADFSADFGIQFQKTLVTKKEDKIRLTLGATYGIPTALKADRTEFLRTFRGNNVFGEIKDTISFVEDAEDVIELPKEIGVGFSIENARKWLFALDYKNSDWGAIASNDNLFTYQSSYSIASGLEYIPKYDGNNYLQRMAYRVGGRFSNSYIAINNVDWNEYGITFGLGLPIRRAESSYPRLNLGVEYGSRGTVESDLIKEKFVNINIGVTINATWFRKRKYD